MAKDIRFAALIRIGCPLHLDVSREARQKPFFAIKKKIVEYLFHEHRLSKFAYLKALQQISLQQLPPVPTSVEYFEKAVQEATNAIQMFGKIYLPWYHWDTMSAEEQQKKDLLDIAPQMIEEWKQAFGDKS